MHKFRRDVDHKLRALQHADKIGDASKAFRYFGVSRASFYLYGRPTRCKSILKSARACLYSD